MAGSIIIDESVYGGTTWVRLRARGADYSLLLPEECVEIGARWVKQYGPPPGPKLTFCTERAGDHFWLCTEDGTGKDPVKIALFKSEEAARSFIDVLALAKMHAHEHGRNGI
jgi:hypothetical protein